MVNIIGKALKLLLFISVIVTSFKSYSALDFSKKRSRKVVGKVSEVTIARIRNNKEPYLYKMKLGLNENGDIVSFIKEVEQNGASLVAARSEFSLSSLKIGILVEKLGFKVLMYDPSKLNPYTGGIVSIYYASDFIKSRFTKSVYRRLDINLVKDGSVWKMYVNNSREINYLFFNVTNNFLGMPAGISGVKTFLK